MDLHLADFTNDVHFNRLIRGQGDRVDLAAAALEIARDEYPDLHVDGWLARLDVMGRQVRERIEPDVGPGLVLAAISDFMFKEGFRGNQDDYYDPRNSFLNEVLDRKLGIPITLSLVYLAIADRVGIALRGVGLPAHFVVKYAGRTQEIFVDPFHEGAFLTRAGCECRVSQVLDVPVTLTDDQLEPAPNDQIVLRLLGNLKAIYLKQEDFQRALRVQQRIWAIGRSDPAEWRDLGMLYFQTNRPMLAIRHLEAYCRMNPEGEDIKTVRKVLKAAGRVQTAMN